MFYALDSLINIMYIMYFDPGHDIKKSSTKGNRASSKNGNVYSPAAHFILILDSIYEYYLMPYRSYD